MDATDSNRKKETFYGYIEEIWELDYGPNFKVPLFSVPVGEADWSNKRSVWDDNS